MIIVSCRKKFTSTRRFSRTLQIRNYPDLPPPPNDLPASSPSPHESLTFSELRTLAADQHLCLLVHGYNNTLPDVLDAYEELQNGMTTHGLIGPGGYGLVVGFAWPGWTSAPGYLVARSAANRAAGYLRRLIEHLWPVAARIDIETHSLGARVGLGALKHSRRILVDNLLLTAPAVDSTILQPGREFHTSLDACNRCFVYHSRKDKTLRKAYPIGDAIDGIQPALGLNGPRSKRLTLESTPNVHVVDCASCVPTHGAYRRAAPVYEHWQRVLSGEHLERYETL